MFVDIPIESMYGFDLPTKNTIQIKDQTVDMQTPKLRRCLDPPNLTNTCSEEVWLDV